MLGSEVAKELSRRSRLMDPADDVREVILPRPAMAMRRPSETMVGPNRGGWRHASWRLGGRVMRSVGLGLSLSVRLDRSWSSLSRPSGLYFGWICLGWAGLDWVSSASFFVALPFWSGLGLLFEPSPDGTLHQ